MILSAPAPVQCSPCAHAVILSRRSVRGFTLIEVLVVVVILAILAGVVVPQLMSYPDEARVTRAQQDIQTLRSALEMYRLDNFVYPSTEQGLRALNAKPSGLPEAPNWRAGGYIRELPKDPWGGDYVFLNPGANGGVDLYSLGADRAPGGEGPNADIGRSSGG
ncbi:MAG TPA: type II secretion system major pseudopilin GspG [Aquimonas sp.]|nr:type II secretion system major pseudopilin GspG [Aquimonas sp.]